MPPNDYNDVSQTHDTSANDETSKERIQNEREDVRTSTFSEKKKLKELIGFGNDLNNIKIINDKNILSTSNTLEDFSFDLLVEDERQCVETEYKKCENEDINKYDENILRANWLICILGENYDGWVEGWGVLYANGQISISAEKVQLDYI